MSQNHHQLLPCPHKPNCVSSLASDPQQFVDALEFPQGCEPGLQKLRQILCTMRGVTITASAAGYIHAECRSRLCGFIDDLEFLWDDDGSRFHVRSASRSGYYDFGVNRRRVESVRKLCEQ